jgi:hypothetical protein
MIALSWNSSFEPNSYDADKHISALVEAYRSLPRHIARKHLGASMRRVLKPAVPILRKNTPKQKRTLRASAITRDTKGRFTKGSGKLRNVAGALRRAATVRVGQTGQNNAFNSFVYGVLGYRAGFESRKAIWLQYGTSRGISPYQMIDKTMAEFGPVAANRLAEEMAKALEKAASEDAAGKNPVRSY